MAVQYCRPNGNGSYTSWTGVYTDWDCEAGSPPTYSSGWIHSGPTGYESCYLEARATPRVSVSACSIYGWAMKNSTSWSLTYGTMLGAAWNQSTGPVTVDTFSMNAYINLSLTVPSDATLDDATYGIGVYTTHTDGYVGGAYFTMTYTPAGGSFMVILSTALAAIGGNLMLSEMPALAAHTFRSSGYRHLLQPADYEPAWHALRAFNHPVWSL